MLQHVHAAKVTNCIGGETMRWRRRHTRLLLIAADERKTNDRKGKRALHTGLRVKTTVANASGAMIHNSKTVSSVGWLHTALRARPVMPANWLTFAEWVRLNRRKTSVGLSRS